MKKYFAIFALAAVFGAAQTAQPSRSQGGAQDPGPRGGAPGAGGPISGMTPALEAVFATALANFQEVENVSQGGLGPRFNSNSCSSCHLHPATGGSSPPANPQLAFANSANRIPPFITASGPVRE